MRRDLHLPALSQLIAAFWRPDWYQSLKMGLGYKMGLDAQVIAVGPFSKDVAPALEYPETFYKNVRDGETVITNVFVAPTSLISHGLAESFGVHAMDLGKHHLSPERADIARLIELFDAVNVERFQRLMRHGFQFYFLPNG